MSRLRLEPLPVRYHRSRVGLSAPVHGARAPFGRRGLYVAFDARGFQYVAQDAEQGGAMPTRSALPADVIPREIALRTNRANLFKAYVWTAGIVLFVALVDATLFTALLIAAVIGAVPVYRWNKRRETTRLFYDIDSDEVVGRLALCNLAADSLARTERLWHVASSVALADRKYNAGASTAIRRTQTQVTRRGFDRIESNIEFWSLPVGPIQLLFLPDQLIVRRYRQWWAVSYADLEAVATTSGFAESDAVPSDSQVVGQTWQYVNKSGGPDRRFNGNRSIPIVAYGELTLTTRSGDRITLQASNPVATDLAATALRELARIAREPAVPPAAEPFRTPAFTPSMPWAQLAPAEPPRPPAPPTYRAQAQAIAAVRSVPTAPPQRVPPPVFRAPLAAVAEPAGASEARFLGASETLAHAARAIPAPLTYVANRAGYGTDASTIVLALPVGIGARAMPMPYWPRYSESDPDQRARYLDWMAGGRLDPEIPLGYVFIFFYGLERRALVEGLDIEPARAEVVRLLGIYGRSDSFRTYASDFLAFTYLRQPEAFLHLTGAEVADALLPLVASSDTARAALAAWHCARHAPLPADYAAIFVRTMEEAKGGTVVMRSADELLALFRIRYREAFGEGVLLEAGKRPLTIHYRPASATLSGRDISVSLPDVFKKVGQFRKIVTIWNECIDDLRKANTKKKGGKQLDAASWAALPDDLRAEYDHPDQDRWDGVVAALPRLATFHLGTVGGLAKLTGIEPSDKLTTAQLKRIGKRASELGYAIEPEPRLRTRAIDPSSEVLVWRAPSTDLPDAKIHGGVTVMLSLAMTVAMADGVFTPEEDTVITSFLTDMFALDDSMRARIEAMKQLVVRDPDRIGNVAKALRTQRCPAELGKIASVLVAIAAADGSVAESEEQTLKRLYRELGLPASDLTAAIARAGARLERDRVVEVQPAAPSSAGEPIPPRSATTSIRLDRAAIDAIVADTKDVAAILAEVFDADEAEPASRPAPASQVSSPASTPLAPAALPRASEETARLAHALDVRYHAALEELLAKEEWPAASVRALGTRHRLMPGAILDTINAWSDEALGDFLIEDSGDWHVRRELVEVKA